MLANNGRMSRRGFANRVSGVLLAAGLPAWFARREAIEAVAASPAQVREKPVVMGAIGVGGRGKSIMQSAQRRGGRFVAVCDVDATHRSAAADALRALGQKEPVHTYNDYRELLDLPEIEAVVIATPDHWHALVAAEALRRGKDVYCEKPLTLTIAEGQALVKLARDTGKVFQTGSQQRSDGRFRLACELVRNGRIGKILTVETRIGENPEGGPFPTAPVPSGLDWDLWLGPTPEVDYVEKRCHNEFRWWYEYSGGKLTDWGAHHNDIAQWGLGTDATGPVRIESSCDWPRHKEPNCFNCPPHFNVTYTYGSGVAKYCDGTRLICTSGGENGVRFVGEGGWIFVSRGRIDASDRRLLEAPLAADAVRLELSADHMRNFLGCVRSRERTICPVEVGHRSVSICHLGNISLRLGNRTLQWDPVRERFLGDALAGGMLSRPRRGAWRFPA